MKEIYLIEIHDMTDNRIHVYQIYAKSIEDAYLQAKVLHNHYRYVVEKAVAEWNSAVIQAEIDAETKAEKTQIIIEQLANMRKKGALMVANKELSEKQKEKVKKEINYMFYELYTKRMSAEAAKELANELRKIENSFHIVTGKRTLKP